MKKFTKLQKKKLISTTDVTVTIYDAPLIMVDEYNEFCMIVGESNNCADLPYFGTVNWLFVNLYTSTGEYDYFMPYHRSNVKSPSEDQLKRFKAGIINHTGKRSIRVNDIYKLIDNVKF